MGLPEPQFIKAIPLVLSFILNELIVAIGR